MVQTNEELIGRTVCILRKSVATGSVYCGKHTVTAIMVQRVQGVLKKTVRLDSGAWENASDLFFPQDEMTERAKFKKRFCS